MLYGLYQSAMGADLQAMKMDVVSNNIANAGTSSFKRDLAVFAVREQQAAVDGRLHEIPPGLQGHPGNPIIADTFTDFSQGPLVATGADLDLAIVGQGFFRVTDGNQEFLTRRGSLTLNADAELVQSDTGLPVLDIDGNVIEVPPGAKVQLDDRGGVFVIDPIAQIPIPVGQLDLVVPENLQSLQKMGDSLYLSPAGHRPANPDTRLRQGFLEQSGVQPIHEMLNMIETSRAFEANMNLIQHQEHTLGQLLQAVGRG